LYNISTGTLTINQSISLISGSCQHSFLCDNGALSFTFSFAGNQNIGIYESSNGNRSQYSSGTAVTLSCGIYAITAV